MSEKGLSLIEVMIVAGVVVTLAALAVPGLDPVRHEWRGRAATRYLVATIMHRRSLAVRLGASVGMRFVSTETGHHIETYVDGDGDGVRSDDIRGEIDRAFASSVRIGDSFPGVRFGLLPSVPAIGGSDADDSGGRPVRLGSSSILTLTPLGTSTPGTLYLHGPGGPQFAVRLFGPTGRVTVLRFDTATARWEER